MAGKTTKKAASGGKRGRGDSGRRAVKSSKVSAKSMKSKPKKPAPKKPAPKKPAPKKPAPKKPAPKRPAPKKPAPKKPAPKKPAPKKPAPKKPAPAKAKTAKAPKAAARAAKGEAGRGSGGVSPGRLRLSPPGKTPKASIRRPEGAEELKQRIGALANATNKIRALKRSLNKSFYEIGQILGEIETDRLYEVKGYGSFEAFLEREIDLGKQLSLRIVRIVQTFLKDAAMRAGLDRASAALDALDSDAESSAGGGAPSSPTSTGLRSPIPLHKQ